jgi:hypothetical protein
MRADETMKLASWANPTGDMELENHEVEELQVDGTWIRYVIVCVCACMWECVHAHFFVCMSVCVCD